MNDNMTRKVRTGIIPTGSLSDQHAVKNAISSIRGSHNRDGVATKAAFVVHRLEASSCAIPVVMVPLLESHGGPPVRDKRGLIVECPVQIGTLGLLGSRQYRSGASRRLDTVLAHELAHIYGLVFEAGVALSQERAIEIENSYRAAKGYELRDGDNDE